MSEGEFEKKSAENAVPSQSPGTERSVDARRARRKRPEKPEFPDWKSLDEIPEKEKGMLLEAMYQSISKHGFLERGAIARSLKEFKLNGLTALIGFDGAHGTLAGLMIQAGVARVNEEGDVVLAEHVVASQSGSYAKAVQRIQAIEKEEKESTEAKGESTLMDFLGDESKSEREVKEFLTALKLSKEGRRNLLNVLLDQGLIVFEGGRYAKKEQAAALKSKMAPTESKKEQKTVETPVEFNKESLAALQEDGRELRRTRDEIIGDMNRIEGAGRPPNADERNAFYNRAESYAKQVDKMTGQGLALSEDGRRARDILNTVVQSRTLAYAEEEDFRRSVIGLEKELFRKFDRERKKVEAAEERLAQQQEVVSEKEVVAAETEKKLDMEALRARGQALEKAQDEMFSLMDSVPLDTLPSDTQREQLYRALSSFLTEAKALQELGFVLTPQEDKSKAALERAMTDRWIFNENKFRRAVAEINDAFLGQFKYLQGNAEVAEPAAELETAPAVLSAPTADKNDEAIEMAFAPAVAEPPVPPVPEEVKPSVVIKAGKPEETAPVVTPESILPEVPSVEIVTSPELALERILQAKAQANMVKEILDLYAKANDGRESRTSQMLITHLAAVVSDLSLEVPAFSPNEGLRKMLPGMRRLLREDGDIRNFDPDSKTGPASWRQVLERMDSGLNESANVLLAAWRKEHPGTARHDFLNDQGIAIQDLAKVAEQWITDLENNNSFNPDLKKMALAQLTAFRRDALARFEVWQEKRLADLEKAKEAVVIPEKSVEEPAPVVSPAPTVRVRAEPLKLGALRSSELSMAQALENESFGAFFDKFDAVTDRPWRKNKLNTPFDPETPFGQERYERALEAYALWREAVGAFLDFMPEGSTPESIEDDLRRRAIENPRQLSVAVENISQYKELKDSAAYKEELIMKLGGFTKAHEELGQVYLDRRDARIRAEALSQTLGAVMRERNLLREADERGSRSFFGRIRDFFRKPVGNLAGKRSWNDAGPVTNRRPAPHTSVESLKEALARATREITGDLGSFGDALIGKEQSDLKARLAQETGLSLPEAGAAYAQTQKKVRALEAQMQEALQDFERLEQRYNSLLNKVDTIARAKQEKEVLVQQFNNIRLQTVVNIAAQKEATALLSDRAKEIMLGLLDDENSPIGVKKIEARLMQLRQVADAAGTRDASDEAIKRADSALTEAVLEQAKESNALLNAA